MASGRSHLTALPVLRMRVSSRPSWCANMIGAGISSGVSFAGVAEHQALVARALLGGLLAFGLAGVHALRDVRALAT